MGARRTAAVLNHREIYNMDATKKAKTEFISRLAAYSGNSHAHSQINWNQKLKNWSVYAAVGGSAMAMASNASANSIVYSGTLDITAGPVASHNTRPASFSSTRWNNGAEKSLTIPGAGKFLLWASQGGLTSSQAISGGAGFKALSNINIQVAAWVRGNYPFGPKRFSSGAEISGANHTFDAVGGSHLAKAYSVHDVLGSFRPGQTGFAPFRIELSGRATDPFRYEYGWVRLEYFNGADGFPNEAEIIDWAYNTTANAPILAGQTDNSPSSAPEPSTAAMALLAAGAGGILAWRRARQSAA